MKIKNPEWLEMKVSGQTVYGLDQLWYQERFRRTAGCGPTTAATLLLYLNKREGGLLQYQNHNVESAVFMLNDVWRFVRPGSRGLYKIEEFVKGIHELCAHYGIAWQCHEMQVTKETPAHEAASFIKDGIAADSPVAFLNLHKGEATAFESWHWIVLTGIKQKQDLFIASGLDGGKKIEFNLVQWITTTQKGGGFVYLT